MVVELEPREDAIGGVLHLLARHVILAVEADLQVQHWFLNPDVLGRGRLHDAGGELLFWAEAVRR